MSGFILSLECDVRLSKEISDINCFWCNGNHFLYFVKLKSYIEKICMKKLSQHKSDPVKKSVWNYIVNHKSSQSKMFAEIWMMDDSGVIQTPLELWGYQTITLNIKPYPFTRDFECVHFEFLNHLWDLHRWSFAQITFLSYFFFNCK